MLFFFTGIPEGMDQIIRYACPNKCGRSFKYMMDMKYHLRHQCGVKFSCNFCDKKYNQKSHLKRHCALVHEVVQDNFS